MRLPQDPREKYFSYRGGKGSEPGGAAAGLALFLWDKQPTNSDAVCLRGQPGEARLLLAKQQPACVTAEGAPRGQPGRGLKHHQVPSLETEMAPLEGCAKEQPSRLVDGTVPLETSVSASQPSSEVSSTGFVEKVRLRICFGGQWLSQVRQLPNRLHQHSLSLFNCLSCADNHSHLSVSSHLRPRPLSNKGLVTKSVFTMENWPTKQPVPSPRLESVQTKLTGQLASVQEAANPLCCAECRRMGR